MDATPNDAGYWMDEYDAPRFWANVNFHGGQAHLNDPLVEHSRVTGDCWLWTGHGSGSGLAGYGRFRIYGKLEQAHRLSYKDFNLKLPNELDVDHLCRTLRCVRPDHLEAVTVSENVRRGKGYLRNRTHCKHGHELTDENITVQKRGLRPPVNACLTCLTKSQQQTYLRRKLRDLTA